MQQAPIAVPVSHYENFPVASWVGPPALRAAISAIYGFARGADDIADEGDDPPAVRLAGLDRYARMLDRIESASDARVEPPGPPSRGAGRGDTPPRTSDRAVSRAPSAFRQDITKPRYADIDELFDYCRRSANPIVACCSICTASLPRSSLAVPTRSAPDCNWPISGRT